MSRARAAKELGRGERVVPGVWRLRLPLPWPGVPHCNAWAIASGDGVVLFDTGLHAPGSMAHLERAMDQVHLRPELVRQVVLTHAHADHCGQAMPVASRSGAPVWLHPDHGHLTRWVADPDAYQARRIEIARHSGIPEEPVRADKSLGAKSYVAGDLRVDHDLVDGVRIETDLGPFTVIETPGHCPSHVALYNPEHRMLVSGDHLLGRISLYFDYGYTPDPVGEFLASLDRIEALDARLALSGHGKTFTDVAGHVRGNRQLVAERLAACEIALAGDAERTPFEIAPVVFGEAITPANGAWLITETLCFLDHLERRGAIEAIGEDPVRYRRL